LGLMLLQLLEGVRRGQGDVPPILLVAGGDCCPFSPPCCSPRSAATRNAPQSSYRRESNHIFFLARTKWKYYQFLVVWQPMFIYRGFILLPK